MPDPWEYPWFAAWDLAFHAVTLAHVDPAFAKYQLLVLCREWFQHPSGALPAYEWSFDDVNPPVHAMAALKVWDIDGRRDMLFLERIFHKLLMNFTWWLNREDEQGQRLVLRRLPGPRQPERVRPFAPAHRRHPGAVRRHGLDVRLLPLDAADGDGPVRTRSGLSRPDDDLPGARRPDRRRHQRTGLWDEDDAFYYDALRLPDGSKVPLKIQSMVGVLPDPARSRRAPGCG